MNTVKIGSINAWGMRDIVKRKKIFKYVRNKKLNMCFLLETHSENIDETLWSNQWGNKIFFSHGLSSA